MSRSSSDNRKRRGLLREFQGDFRIYRLRYFDPREAGKDFDRRQIPSDSVLYLRRDENYRTDRPDPLFIRRQKLGFEASFIPKRDAEDKRNR